MKKRFLPVLVTAALILTNLPVCSFAGSYNTQSELAAATISDFGAHCFTGADAVKVTTEITPNADGSISVESSDMHNGMGVTYTRPVYLNKEGASVEFSLSQYDTASSDKWFAFYLSDKMSYTDGLNETPVFGQQATNQFDSAWGRGFFVMMRPDGDGKLRIGYYYYGVTSANDATAKSGTWIFAGNGCYDNIQLNSGNYDNITFELVKRSEGGYNIVFNNGAFTRVGSDRISDEGGVNPMEKFTFLDQIFTQGTKAYVKLTEYNAADYDSIFKVHNINGSYANLENTLESWGVHNYTALDGSQVVNEISSTDKGEIQINGTQSAGEGSVGVTYARPLDLNNGFSFTMDVDQYGKEATDSWFGIQLTDKMTVTDNRNQTDVFRRFEVGKSSYGAGLVLLVRPKGNGIFAIDYCWTGIDGKAQATTPSDVFIGDGDGCYNLVQVENEDSIKFTFKELNGGVRIILNDGNYKRLNGNLAEEPRCDAEGEINPANSYPGLIKYFSDKAAYFAVSYHDNTPGGAPTQFKVKNINGMQAAPNTLNSFSAHNYTDISGSSIVTNTSLDGKGGLVVSGSQTSGDGGIGVTFNQPVDMTGDISMNLSFDTLQLNSVSNPDTGWLAVSLLDKATITDSRNTQPVARRFEVGNPDYGAGLVILLRPRENNVLGIGEIYWNGVKFTPDPVLTSGAFDWDANGCYSMLQLDSLQNVKISFEHRGEGGYNIVINDGAFLRLSTDNPVTADNRMSDDYGCINVANKYSKLEQLFPAGTPAYLNIAYKGQGIPVQFTVNKVNGIHAAPLTDGSENNVLENGVYDLFKDLKFEQGFTVTGLSSKQEGQSTPGIFNYGMTGLNPQWTLAQWDSKYDFRDQENNTVFMQTGDTAYQYLDPSKSVTVDTATGEIGLKLMASAVYDAPRASGESWPHLLISNDKGIAKGRQATPGAYQLKNVSQLRLQLSQKLSFYEDHMGAAADPGLHAASFYIYIYIKGTNDKNQTEMTWFGINLFDSRTPYTSEIAQVDGGKADASGLFIYTLPSKSFTTQTFHQNGTPVGSDDNAWMDLDVDLVPYIQRSLVLANEQGFMKGVTLDSIYIDGMNMGWEMPGTYDAEMRVKNLSLKSYVGTTYEQTGSVRNLPVFTMNDNETIAFDESFSMTVPKNTLEVDGIDAGIYNVSTVNNSALNSIGGKKVIAAYTSDLALNGTSYLYEYDNPVTLSYQFRDADFTAGGSNLSNFKFYAVSQDGTTTEVTPVSFDSATKTAVFATTKMINLAVVNTTQTVSENVTPTPTTAAGNNNGTTPTSAAGENTNPATGQSNAPWLPVAILSATGLVFAGMKRKIRTDGVK